MIHPPYRVFYQLSIDSCVQSAVRSIDFVGDLVERLDEARSLRLLKSVDSESLLNELQNIITQGAAVSRYFWPVRAKYEARGRELMQMYGVTDDSPLRSRELRNAIEHFDERLDEYLADGVVGNVFPYYIGLESTSEQQVKSHFFRAYFVNTGTFQLLDHRFAIDPLAEELWRLAQLPSK